MMEHAGLTPVVPEGGFFTMGDTSVLPIEPQNDDNDAFKYVCSYLKIMCVYILK